MRCILHIGTEKTATTTLQEWLYDNRNTLSAHRVALTDVSSKPNNRRLVGYFQERFDEFFRAHDVRTHQEKSRFFADFEQKFADEIQRLKAKHDTVIFTSEHFHSRLTSIEQIKSLKFFLDRYFDDFQIICYFREQSKVRTSLYSTALKSGSVVKIDDYQKDVDSGSHYYNYLIFLDKWEAVFGQASLRPRLFEQHKLIENDIRIDFLSTVLPNVDPDTMRFETSSANMSLSNDEAAVFRRINQARRPYIGQQRDPLPLAIKEIIREFAPINRSEPVFDARQRDFYDLFNDSNIAFFDKYFGERRNMFPAPESTSTQKASENTLAISDVSQLVRKLIGFAGILFLRKREIDHLRDLAIRLKAEGKISNEEAVFLLKIASRARPDGKGIVARIDELR